jgi:hypothetical protein
MFIHEMSNDQRLELGVIEQRFRQNAWDLEPVSGLLHSGTWTRPQVSADLNREDVELGCDLYFDDGRGLLTVENPSRRLQFQITCKPSLLPLVDWLISNQGELSPTNFAEQLRSLITVCEQVVYLTAGKQYLLQADDSLNGFDLL